MAKTKANRTPESEMRIAALQVARAHGGFATTTQAKAEIHKYVDLTPEDHKASLTRKEPMYYQIVGNVVCHEGSSRSIFNRGFAARHPDYDGFSITELGEKHLKDLGF